MKNQHLQAVRGMNDILPDEADRWRWLEGIVASWLDGYGYRNIRTPILEPTALFCRAIGEVTDIVEKEMYSFIDTLNGDSLTLRPEGTAACVRAVIQHHLLYQAPQRLWYAGAMFRHERPQRGRYRQFHQVGVEALGFDGPDVDAEHILMCRRLWQRLGIGGIELQVNSLGDAAERTAYRAALIAYLRQHHADLDEEAKRRLETNPLRILDSKHPQVQAVVQSAPILMDYLGEVSLTHFESFLRILQAHNVDYVVNARLVRGLDYYNRTVFEWVAGVPDQSITVCAGGRYDTLIDMLGGKPAPACGFAFGLERVLALVADVQLSTRQSPQIYIVHAGELAQAFAFRLAEHLRDLRFTVLLHCGLGSFKSQMKRADASGARVALIVGDNEVLSHSVVVKSLRDDVAQMTVSYDDIPRVLSDICCEH